MEYEDSHPTRTPSWSNVLPGRNKEQQYPQLVFKITQHLRDKELLNYLISYFNCGKLYKDRNAYDFKVTKF